MSVLDPTYKNYIDRLYAQFVATAEYGSLEEGNETFKAGRIISKRSVEKKVKMKWDMDRLINALPTHWKFKSNHQPTVLPGCFEAEQLVFLEKGMTVAEVIDRAMSEEVVVECSVANAFVYLLGMRMFHPTMIPYLDEIPLNFFALRGLICNSIMFRHFRMGSDIRLPPFAFDQQGEKLKDVPIGSHVYIRGVFMWLLAEFKKPLKYKMIEYGMTNAFQGENAIWTGKGLLGFWNDGDGNGQFEVKQLDEIVGELGVRFQREFDALPAEQRDELLDMYDELKQNVRFPGVNLENIKYNDVVGAQQAVEYILIA